STVDARISVSDPTDLNLTPQQIQILSPPFKQRAVAMNSQSENLRWSFFNALKLSMKLELDADTWSTTRTSCHNLAFVTSGRGPTGCCPSGATCPSQSRWHQLQKYHTDHHRWLGHDQNDVDIPTGSGGAAVPAPGTKLLWLCAHPFIHALRPFVKSPKPRQRAWEVFNFACCARLRLGRLQILRGEAALLLGHRVPRRHQREQEGKPELLQEVRKTWPCDSAFGDAVKCGGWFRCHKPRNALKLILAQF
uniref:C-type lectin domain-containing protein n=1 Tax=Macrostomum lignano TaxID=282301 RepID=A0A1I8F7M4_9PLAT